MVKVGDRPSARAKAGNARKAALSHFVQPCNQELRHVYANKVKSRHENKKSASWPSKPWHASHTSMVLFMVCDRTASLMLLPTQTLADSPRSSVHSRSCPFLTLSILTLSILTLSILTHSDMGRRQDLTVGSLASSRPPLLVEATGLCCHRRGGSFYFWP